MNRYTFKAKRKDNGEWVYGDLLNLYDGRKYIVNNQFGACIDNKGNFINTEAPFTNEIIPETLCQCTGLQDRDCEYIFENDIVEYIYEVNNSPFKANEQGVISYESTGFYYETIKGTQKYGSRAGWLVSIPNDNGKLFKIIGNKFDKEED